MGAVLECHIYDGNGILIFPECVIIHHFQKLRKCIQVWPTTWSNCDSRNSGPDKGLSGSDIKDETQNSFAFLSPRDFPGKSTGNDLGGFEVLESLTKFFC